MRLDREHCQFLHNPTDDQDTQTRDLFSRCREGTSRLPSLSTHERTPQTREINHKLVVAECGGTKLHSTPCDSTPILSDDIDVDGDVGVLL